MSHVVSDSSREKTSWFTRNLRSSGINRRTCVRSSTKQLRIQTSLRRSGFQWILNIDGERIVQSYIEITNQPLFKKKKESKQLPCLEKEKKIVLSVIFESLVPSDSPLKNSALRRNENSLLTKPRVILVIPKRTQ